MKPVLDASGTPIVGVFKDPVGSIVVDDQAAYEKYKREKKNLEKVATLAENYTDIMHRLDHLEDSVDKIATLLVAINSKLGKL
jgi:hypothetical protein